MHKLNKQSQRFPKATIGDNVFMGTDGTLGDGSFVGWASRINDGFKIGRKCIIGERVNIGHNVQLDDNIFLGQSVYLGGSSHYGVNVFIGDSTHIGSNNKIGSDTTIEQNSLIENNCTFGTHINIEKSTCIDNCVKIGNNTSIDNNVIIGNKCILGNDINIGDHTDMRYGVKIYDRVKIKTDCRICNNVIIKSDVKIGQHVDIGLRTIIHQGANIGDITETKYLGIVGGYDSKNRGVVIGQYVDILPGCTIKSGCILPDFSSYRANAIIKKGYEGVVLNDSNRDHISYYYDFFTKEMIIVMYNQHKTIKHWDADLSINISKSSDGPNIQSESIKLYNDIKSLALDAFDRIDIDYKNKFSKHDKKFKAKPNKDGYYTSEDISIEFHHSSKRKQGEILWDALDLMKCYNNRSKYDCRASAMGYTLSYEFANLYTKKDE